MAGWASLEELVYQEVVQRAEEGCDTAGFRERIAGCGGDAEKLTAVYAELSALPVREDFPYTEPDGWEEIRAAAETKEDAATAPIPREELRDRMQGAWLGRCIGCALGKPFECGEYVAGDGKTGAPAFIREWLKGADAYPLDGYVPGTSRAADRRMPVICPDSQRERIAFMESDDDIRYLVTGLLLAEQCGDSFTPDDVARIWMQYLPAGQCCTAERQAYINCLNTEIADDEQRWAYIRGHMNPYREWIGAQIRVDQYAYIHAGYPLRAARTAWQDARFSHVKNGVYGAMFVAAMIAAAFRERDAKRCVEIGLSVIPRTSRLYEAVGKAVAAAEQAGTAEELQDRLWEMFGAYNWVHTINNAAACAAAIVFGGGDFSQTLTAAVCCGWDTDCNGATVGSFLGAFCGASRIPEHWKQPLHDTLYSGIPDFHPVSISACAARSLAVYDRLHGNGSEK